MSQSTHSHESHKHHKHSVEVRDTKSPTLNYLKYGGVALLALLVTGGIVYLANGDVHLQAVEDSNNP